jgi:hypothetical protein
MRGPLRGRSLREKLLLSTYQSTGSEAADISEGEAEPKSDRGECVCAGGHRPQTHATGVQPLPNPTDTKHYAFRENVNITSTSGNRLPIRFIRLQQPTDSV